MSDQNNLEPIENAIKKLNEDIEKLQNDLSSYSSKYSDGKLDTNTFHNRVQSVERIIKKYRDSLNVLIKERKILKSKM